MSKPTGEILPKSFICVCSRSVQLDFSIMVDIYSRFRHGFILDGLEMELDPSLFDILIVHVTSAGVINFSWFPACSYYTTYYTHSILVQFLTRRDSRAENLSRHPRRRRMHISVVRHLQKAKREACLIYIHFPVGALQLQQPHRK